MRSRRRTGFGCARWSLRSTAGASRAPTARVPVRPKPPRAPWPSCAARALPRYFPRLAAKPLKAKGIVVTRPAGQADGLVGLIEAQGGRALRFPAIEIQDVPGWRLPPLEGVALAVFASPTAVHKVFGKLEGWPQGLRAAAVGRGTRRALERHGVADVLAPEIGADSEALLALAPMHEVAGK